MNQSEESWEVKYPTTNQKAVTKSLAAILESINVEHTIVSGKIVVSNEKMDESDIEILNGLAEQINLTIDILKPSK